MKLSIITINRNNLSGLEKTMQSVLAQTYTDFEYIVVDGASTDGSKELIERLAISEKRLTKWISEKDTGIFHAMNKGIKLASGEYLLFLNSGDFLYAADVLSDVFSTNTYSEDFICARCAISNLGNVEFITSPPKVFTFQHFFETTLAHQSTFIKRSLFDTYGLYREDLKLKGDWEFFVRTIILNACSTTNVDVILTDFNKEGVSSSKENRALQKKEMELIYNETVLHKFVPDYVARKEKIHDLKPYIWLQNKRIIHYFVLQLFKIARRCTKNKNKF